jgi:predicted PurR-regulated permease PerM
MPPTLPQFRARLAAAACLIALGLWILRSFLVPLAWAVILGIATWPLHARLRRALDPARGETFLWTTLLGILLGGILLGGIETFGLLGLFLGPTVMAILMSVWRDCAALEPADSQCSAATALEPAANPPTAG